MSPSVLILYVTSYIQIFCFKNNYISTASLILFYYFMSHLLHLLYPVIYKTGRTVSKTYCLVPDWRSYWQGFCMLVRSGVQVIGGLR